LDSQGVRPPAIPHSFQRRRTTARTSSSTMTILPSIFSTPQLAQGHVYHSASMPPRSRTMRLGEPGAPHHPSLEMSQSLRTRTEWLSSQDAKIQGEIRNIHVLGIIKEKMVVSFQGSGRVRVFVNNEHSLELEDIGTGEWNKKYSDHVMNSKNLRYAEFRLPSLPAQVLVIGETATSEDPFNPAVKPISEARSLCKVCVSGHVTSQQRFQGTLGAPGHPNAFSRSGAPGNISLAAGTRSVPSKNSTLTIPKAQAGAHYQTLSASQKSYQPIDPKKGYGLQNFATIDSTMKLDGPDALSLKLDGGAGNMTLKQTGRALTQM